MILGIGIFALFVCIIVVCILQWQLRRPFCKHTFYYVDGFNSPEPGICTKCGAFEGGFGK